MLKETKKLRKLGVGGTVEKDSSWKIITIKGWLGNTGLMKRRENEKILFSTKGKDWVEFFFRSRFSKILNRIVSFYSSSFVFFFLLLHFLYFYIFRCIFFFYCFFFSLSPWFILFCKITRFHNLTSSGANTYRYLP